MTITEDGAEEANEGGAEPERAAGRVESCGAGAGSRRGSKLHGLHALAGVGGRSERSVGFAISAMLVVVAAAIAVAPRALERAEANSLEQAIAEAPAVQKRLGVRIIGDFPSGSASDPVEAQQAVVDSAAESVPDVVTSSFGTPRLMIDTNRFQVTAINDQPLALPTSLTFRIHPELADHSQIVEGRAAARTTDRRDGVRLFEFELSAVAAQIMELNVGDFLDVQPDASDSVTRQYSAELPEPFVGRLVGLRELDEQRNPYWFGDSRLHRPTVTDSGQGASFFVFGSISADSLLERPFLVSQRSPLLVEQRRDLDAGSVTVGSSDALLDGLVALDASASAVPTAGRAGIVSSLRRVLGAEADQRDTARSTLVLAAIGVLGVALAALAQLLQLAFARRRAWLSVARARGASSSQVVTTTTIEIAVLAAIAIAVGWLVVRVPLGGSRSSVETWLLLTLWIGSVAMAGILAAVEVHRPVGASTAATRQHLSKWGSAAGAVLIAVAAGGFVTFRRRGLSDSAGTIDALAALLPVLVPLAVVLLSRWVLPFILGLVSRLGMDLGPGRLLGIRRAMADPGSGAGLVAILTLALTVTGLGLGINQSLERGITNASWNEVGAPYRIDSRNPDLAAEVGRLPGVQSAEYGDNQFRLDRDGEVFTVRFINVETTELEALTEATTADLRAPSALLALDADGRVPAIASTRIGGERVRRGDTFRGSGSLSNVEFVVAQVRREAFGRERDWLVADRGVYESVASRPASTSSIVFDMPPETRPAVQALVTAEGLDLEDRVAIQSRQRDDPLTQIVRRGYLAAGLFATLLALLAVAGLAIMTSRQRRREVAILGLLGARRGETGRAVRSELIPPTLAGVVLGTALGWLMTTTFDGRFDVSAFADGTPVPLRPELSQQVVIGGVVALVSLIIIAVLVRRIVRARVHEILRVAGD